MATCRCYKCQTEKDENEFGWKNKAQGKRSPWCKECRREYDRKTRRDRYLALKQKRSEDTEPVS